jgi:hypothetical protein
VPPPLNDHTNQHAHAQREEVFLSIIHHHSSC